jgi:hypothetical protein
MVAATLTIVCTTTTAAVLPAGAQSITFAPGQLTTGEPRLAVTTGLTIATSADVVSFPTFSSLALGGQISKVALVFTIFTCQMI